MPKRKVRPQDARLHQIHSNTPIPTAAEERALVIAMNNGDDTARETLFLAHYPFVVDTSKSYRLSGDLRIDRADLVSEGVIGFSKALERFDVDKGFRLITYAKFWVREEMRQFIAAQAPVALPADVLTASMKVKDVGRNLGHTLVRDMEEAELPKYQRHALPILTHNHHSIEDLMATLEGHDNALPPDLSAALADTGADPAVALDGQYLNWAIKDALDGLTERDAQTIILYYGLQEDADPMTLQQIADRYGVTRESVRQWKERALLHMKDHPGIVVYWEGRND